MQQADLCDEKDEKKEVKNDLRGKLAKLPKFLPVYRVSSPLGQ